MFRTGPSRVETRAEFPGPHAVRRTAGRSEAGRRRSEPIGSSGDRASVLRRSAYPSVRCEPWTRTEQDPAGPLGRDPLDQEDYRLAVVDLLGVLAYGELTAFERLADDASFAPTIADKAALARDGGRRVPPLRAAARPAGRARGARRRPRWSRSSPALEAFHERTAPGDWLEGLVKAYVGDGIAEDFYREVSAYLDDSTRDLVLEVLEDTGHSAVRGRPGAGRDRGRPPAGRAAGAVGPPAGRRGAQPGAAGGRRAGRAGRAARRRAVDRPGADLAEVGRMFARLTENHTTPDGRPRPAAGLTPATATPKPTRRLSARRSRRTRACRRDDDLPAALVGQRRGRRRRRSRRRWTAAMIASVVSALSITSSRAACWTPILTSTGTSGTRHAGRACADQANRSDATRRGQCGSPVRGKPPMPRQDRLASSRAAASRGIAPSSASQ